MSHKWAPKTWDRISRAFHSSQSQAHKSAASLPSSGTAHCRVHVPQPYCYRVGYLSWRHIHHLRNTGRKGWPCKANQVRQRLGLHNSAFFLNTSASRWSAGLSQHMSRVRNTLDTVSKAVSGTHTELLSKIAKLKPNALKGGKKGEAIVESAQKAEESAVSPTPAPTDVAPPSTSNPPKPICGSSSIKPSILTSAATSDANATAATHSHNPSPATVAAAVLAVGEPKEKRVRRVVPAVKASSAKKQKELKPSLSDDESKGKSSQQTTALFHPSTLSVSLDETYNYLAHHINSYFGSSTNVKKVENVYSSSAPSQAPQASDLMPVPGKTVAAAPVTLPSAKKGLGHYLSYSAPTVQAFVGSYIAPLVPKFRTAEYKSAIVEVKKTDDAPVKPMEVTTTNEPKTAEEKAKKLILQREKIIARVSVDNRTRALVQALHRASDVRVYINRVEDLSYHLLEFPETCGVAVKEQVIPCLLRLKQASDPGLGAAVREALALVGYHKPVKGRGFRILSIDGGGLRGLVALQALHKLEALTGKPIYKLFDYICGVSTGAILGFMLGVFQIPLNECDDLYRKLGSDVFKQNVIVGTVKMGWNHAFYDSEAWENILREKMGSQLLVETSRNPECPKDGGLLINNPTALAIHECKCLWPDTPLECVVSLGTGRFETPGNNSTTHTSLKTKLTNVISSATDTEEVHAMLDAFLPPDTYFRFNPFMNEDISMDESRHEKLSLLQADGLRYLERNEEKLKKVVGLLTREKSSVQTVTEWARLRANMYNFNSSKI
uniref:PNPLA domain-containing protein n=1 Tax=Gasterosteus aculeatus aculeatus TaxID=481459 RepID=A0AAQ4PK06_GASAC